MQPTRLRERERESKYSRGDRLIVSKYLGRYLRILSAYAALVARPVFSLSPSPYLSHSLFEALPACERMQGNFGERPTRRALSISSQHLGETTRRRNSIITLQLAMIKIFRRLACISDINIHVNRSGAAPLARHCGSQCRERRMRRQRGTRRLYGNGAEDRKEDSSSFID